MNNSTVHKWNRACIAVYGNFAELWFSS